MATKESSEEKHGLIYHLFEISFAFSLMMGVVFLYILLLTFIVEEFVVGYPLTNKDEILIMGSIGGAMAITIASSIWSIGKVIKKLTKIVVVNGVPDLSDPESIIDGYVPKPDEKGKEDKKISYDFNYY